MVMTMMLVIAVRTMIVIVMNLLILNVMHVSEREDSCHCCTISTVLTSSFRTLRRIRARGRACFADNSSDTSRLSSTSGPSGPSNLSAGPTGRQWDMCSPEASARRQMDFSPMCAEPERSKTSKPWVLSYNSQLQTMKDRLSLSFATWEDTSSAWGDCKSEVAET